MFSPSGNIRRLAPDTEISAFRIVQEALSNVVKHSGATLAEVILDFGQEELRISVSDNGVGFVVGENAGSSGRAGQMGLVGMFERAEIMGASLDIDSKPGAGAKLQVSIPLKGGGPNRIARHQCLATRKHSAEVPNLPRLGCK